MKVEGSSIEEMHLMRKNPNSLINEFELWIERERVKCRIRHEVSMDCRPPEVTLKGGRPARDTGSFLAFFTSYIFRLRIENEINWKVIFPDKTSARFLSFIGNIDKRFELDPSINPGDKRYYAALSVMAAKASYENKNYIESVVKDHWKEISTTQAFILEDTKNDTVVVAFRGTEPFDADSWSSDFDISWYELPNIGKIHGGFLKALGLQLSQGWPQSQADDKPVTAYYAVRKLLKEHLTKNENAKFIITGHSLGGALAALFPAVLALHEESALLDRIEGIYTFGQPRVGDEEFGEFMKKAMEKHGLKFFRFVYSFDLVPRLPYDDKMLMFKHFGTCIYYNSFYQGRVVAEEPDKNYFSIKWVIPKMINACWELIRSFVISYRKGADYEEGFLLRMIRVVGIIMAGLPAHCPQDYVNSTRLGSSDLFIPSILTSSNDQKISKMK
ncbi:hypothetical protein DH2020_037574 [Rehmannia glutinosa]|uniref:Fungal lipase-type domain-containing protein n=1 Tax=Rehmannia glutinosa TaxID=99300 RepID=A0ABR0V308_REHGL